MKTKLLASAAVLGLAASGGANALGVTASTDATAMANKILGSGVSLVGGTASYTGAADQSGFFDGGGTNPTTHVGIDEGVLLTTGRITDVPGPNVAPPETRSGEDGVPDIDTGLGLPGDAALDALAGFNTFDAAVLEFDFTFDSGSKGNVFVQYVFGSEEYVDYVDTQFNDVFGFFIGDSSGSTNIALVPGSGDPVTINTINDVANSAFYRNNVEETTGVPPLTSTDLLNEVSFDGLTTVLTASISGLDTSQTYTMRFAVADGSDAALDAGVFLAAGSFSTEDPDDNDGRIPVPTPLAILGVGLLAMASRQRRKPS